MADPTLNLRIFEAKREHKIEGDWAVTKFTVPTGHKIISGGARVNYRGAGNILMASYPDSVETWIARSKDSAGPGESVDPCDIDVWVTAIADPKDEWEVMVISNQNANREPWPQTSAQLPVTYDDLDQLTLSGGGACTHSKAPDDNGNFLVASFPVDERTWQAVSKDHRFPDHQILESFIIGFRWRLGRLPQPLVPKLFFNQTAERDHPEGSCDVDAGYILLGGGAFDQSSGPGNLLTCSAIGPGGSSWMAKGKDHAVSSPGHINVYAIGIKRQNWMAVEVVG